MKIPNGSMLPMVPVGGLVLVIPTKQVRIGDVVTFRLPKDTSIIYMKRVIGAAGDKIQMINGVLNINGQAVKRERVEDYILEEEGLRKPSKTLERNFTQRRELYHARSRG